MRRLRGDSGLTLVEVLMALVLTGLALAAVYSFYISGVGAWQKGAGRMEHQQNARAAVDLVVRELRFADWVALPAGGEIRFKLNRDPHHEDPQYFRRFRLSGEQLLLEEIRAGSGYSCNVVAGEISAVNFSLDASGNVHITVTAGVAGDEVTLKSSVRPRNLPDDALP